MVVEPQNALPRWDLSSYGYGQKLKPIENQITDPQIAADLAEAQKRAEAFRDAYKDKGIIAQLDGNALAAVITEYEKIDEMLSKPKFFFRLAEVINLENTTVTDTTERINKEIAGIEGNLVFFASELKGLDEQELQSKIATSQALQQYKPWLAKLRSFKPYQLSDAREQALHDTEHERTQKWISAFNKKQAALRFPMPNELLTPEDAKKYNVQGLAGETLLTGVELSDYMENPNENARKAAYLSRAKVFADHIDEFVEITNTLAKDKAQVDSERGFPTPLASRNLYNEVEDDVINALVTEVRSNYPQTSHRYYKLKAEMLGKDKLDMWDLIAPSPIADNRHIPWEEAKEIILKAFHEFSPEMADTAKLFFDNGWIDAAPRAGKDGGGFCEAPCKSSPPTIMINYQGKMDDVLVLAHELGHGMNMYLAKRKHSQLMADMDKAPITTSEVPSTFAEEIVFQALLKHAKTDEEKISLLTHKVNNLTGTVIRQMAFHVFETDLHNAARKGKALNAEELGKMWMNSVEESVGPAVKMDDKFKTGWARIPHFVHYPFYVHAYAFACLMSGNLSAQRQKGTVEHFPEKIIDLYTDMPVKHHSELMAPFGLDARKPAFWKEGMDMFKHYIDELEALVAKKHGTHASQTPDYRDRIAQGRGNDAGQALSQ